MENRWHLKHYLTRTLRRTRCLVAIFAVALLSSRYAKSYGVITHAAISSNAYNSAFLTTIQRNFFKALQLDPQQTFGPVPTSPPAGIGPFTAQVWIIAGSQHEDDTPLPLLGAVPVPVARVLFHFLDPFYHAGLSVPVSVSLYGLPLTLFFIESTSTASDWGVFGSGSTLLCPVPPACIPVPFTNDFPYSSPDPTKDARAHFLNGLTNSDPNVRSRELGVMFRSLGQLIHLVQDMAQPQHTRNDAHLDLSATSMAWVPLLQRPSVYERYVDAHPFWKTLPGTGTAISFSLPQLFFANGSGSGIAQFTNSNFVSTGTNCTNTITCNAAGGYPLPVMTGGPTNTLFWKLYGYAMLADCQTAYPSPSGLCNSVVKSFSNQVVDNYTGQSSLNPEMTTYSLFDLDLLVANKSPVFSLNHFSYDQQAQILIPKAVDYSAGLLNYFFRGSISAQGNGQGGITITNASGEDMNGTFSLYYDAAPVPGGDGMRHQVPGASWQLSIPAGATSAAQSFTPPTNPPPQTSGQYILVFQGSLGAEGGAVVGAVVEIQTNTCPTCSGTITSIACYHYPPLPGYTPGVVQATVVLQGPIGTTFTTSWQESDVPGVIFPGQFFNGCGGSWVWGGNGTTCTNLFGPFSSGSFYLWIPVFNFPASFTVYLQSPSLPTATTATVVCQ